MTNADFLIEDPFSGLSDEDKLKAHPKKFEKKFQKSSNKIPKNSKKEGAWGGASVAWVSGVPGWATSHAPPPVYGECGRGPLPAGCWCGGCGHGDPSPIPQRALASWLCALSGRHEGARGGGVSCLGVMRP